MLTEKQKNNIYNLPDEDLIEIDEIIQEKLGAMLMKDFLPIYGKSRPWLQQECKSGKIKSKKIGNKFFPYVNVFLKT